LSTPQPWSSAAAATRRIGHRVEYHPEIGSTNDRARELLRSPGGEGVAVVADLQTAGRGRRGRRWLSPPGRNLMVSVALRPALAPADAWQLTAAAALAAWSACSRVAPAQTLAIKWPNDLVAADGRKLGGMLLETSLDGERLSEAVIGIGLNVNWRRAEMPPQIAERATSLADLSGAEIDRVGLLSALLAALDADVAAVERGDSPLERYRRLSWLDGRAVQVDLGDRRVEGTVHGVAADGSLRLLTAGGTVDVSHGEVAQVVAEAVPA
jgi:BirA family transcriptional regulator, biotin operon repressor / biotin---[acetyl-CoA-carboxylase] ligase